MRSLQEVKSELQEALKDLQNDNLFKVFNPRDNFIEYLGEEDFELESHIRQGEIAAMISDSNYDRNHGRD